MSWIQLSTHTTPEAIDWIRTLLSTNEHTKNIKISHQQKSANETLDGAGKSSWSHTIYLYLPDDQYRQVPEIIELLSSLHRTGMIDMVQVDEIENGAIGEIAINSPMHQVGNFLILPPLSNESAEPTDQIVLKLESSLAFGSGLHPATVLSLKLLERYTTPGKATLDLGCGSGILSVAMAKLGASVTAIDNDPIAVEATQRVIQQNAVADRVNVLVGSLGRGSELGHWMGGNLTTEVTTLESVANFDLIAANILARIHITLATDYQNALRRSPTGGLLITAGYTTDYASDIDTAFTEAGFEQVDRVQLEDWIAFAHKLK